VEVVDVEVGGMEEYLNILKQFTCRAKYHNIMKNTDEE
jgi:hypothetical protein